jgi:DNA-binding MarR family transcriptional regulator
MAKQTSPQTAAARADLAAMLVPLSRELVAAELPVLAEHGLSMWAFVVLSALARADAPSQGTLAERIGADKTRIITVLDDLQHQGLIRRDPDQEDRRARVLTLTAAGRRRHAVAQAAIQRGEEQWLGRLTTADRAVFLRCLQTLTV